MSYNTSSLRMLIFEWSQDNQIYFEKAIRDINNNFVLIDRFISKTSGVSFKISNSLNLTEVTFSHNLSTPNPSVNVIDLDTKEVVFFDVTYKDESTISLKSKYPIPSNKTFKIMIGGAEY